MNNKELLLNDIMVYLKQTVSVALEELPEQFPIFTKTKDIMESINNYYLKDFDDTLFENIIKEVINYLN